MKLKKLIIVNLFSHRKTVIHFDRLDLALFVGLTGSGKSSIFDVLTWVMYEKTARKKYKRIVRDVPDKKRTGYGILQYENNGIEYAIKRIAGYKKNVFYYQDGKKRKLRTKTLVNNEIIKDIGIDYETFLNISYFSQGDIGRFLSADSSKRIDIISKMFNLSVLDKAKKSASKKLSEIENKFLLQKGKIETYQEFLSNVDIKSVQNERKYLEQSLINMEGDLTGTSQDLVSSKEKLELQNNLKDVEDNYQLYLSDYKDLIKEFNSKISNIKRRSDDVESLNNKLEKIVDKINSIELIEKRIKSKKRKIVNVKNKISKIDDNISRIEIEYEEYDKITGMSGSKCPVCKTNITSKNVAEIKNNQHSLRDDLAKLGENKGLKENRLKTLLNSVDELKKKCLKKDKIVQKRKSVEKKISEVKNKGKIIKELQEHKNVQKERSKKNIADLKKKIKNLKQDIGYYSDYDVNNIEQLQIKYDSLVEKINRVNNDLILIKSKIKQYNSYKYKIDKIKKKINKLSKVIDLIRWWYDSYPKIKLNIINNIIPLIESETNKYLSQLLNGKVIKFKVNPSKLTNKMNIVIYDYEHKVKRIFEGWSGGEKDCLTISICLALNKLSSLKSGNKIQFMIFDEKFTFMDTELRNKVFDILKSESDRSIYAISHISEIESEFKQIVKVKKVNKVSEVNHELS